VEPVDLGFTPYRKTGWAAVAWPFVALRRVNNCQRATREMDYAVSLCPEFSLDLWNRAGKGQHA
jgi:hypothetical protein